MSISHRISGVMLLGASACVVNRNIPVVQWAAMQRELEAILYDVAQLEGVQIPKSLRNPQQTSSVKDIVPGPLETDSDNVVDLNSRREK